ncbi:hypothetical protein WBP06_00555 [Novosphingobium sp. BL-8H]|uniref:hypothetical protein n=1 Tax=Novosphingobium sp. BL-8H TaxID=3127640 RepID=UPI003757D2FC
MSFDSDLHIAIIGLEIPHFEKLKNNIIKQLDEDGISHDVFQDIVTSFTDGRGQFRLHSAYLMDFLDKIAPLFPEVNFDARGLGEEFRDTWVAEYREGRREYTQGPWDYDAVTQTPPSFWSRVLGHRKKS